MISFNFSVLPPKKEFLLSHMQKKRINIIITHHYHLWSLKQYLMFSIKITCKFSIIYLVHKVRYIYLHVKVYVPLANSKVLYILIL